MLTIPMQVGGPSKLVTANPRNDVPAPAPVTDGLFGNTAILWPITPASGIVTAEVQGTPPGGGMTCKFTAINAGTVTGQIQAHSLSNVLITFDFTIVVAPAPVNEATHFEPTVEDVP